MRDVFAAFLGTIIVSAFIALVGGLMFYPTSMEGAQAQLVTTFMGALMTMGGVVVSFYFGSSSSDKAKNDTITTLSNTAATTANTAAAVVAGTGNGAAPSPGTVDVTGTVEVSKPKGGVP